MFGGGVPIEVRGWPSPKQDGWTEFHREFTGTVQDRGDEDKKKPAEWQALQSSGSPQSTDLSRFHVDHNITQYHVGLVRPPCPDAMKARRHFVSTGPIGRQLTNDVPIDVDEVSVP